MAVSSTSSPIPSWKPISASCTNISVFDGAPGNKKAKLTTGERHMHRMISLTALAVALGCGSAQAQYTDGTIKIGVMNDMSGTYKDLSGPGSVVAAKMAVEDFGAAAKGMKVEIVG